jgi:hypothetical protein
MLENLKVQDALEEAKVVRRPIIRYIQVSPSVIPHDPLQV